MHKVVFDANVLVSALFGGKPRKAFLKALRSCKVYVSPEIRQELLYLLEAIEQRIDRAKLKRLRTILTTLLSNAEELVPTKRINLSRDKKDNAYLALCLKAKANYLLAGDRDLLEIPQEKLKSAGLNRLKIITPDRFLSEVL